MGGRNNFSKQPANVGNDSLSTLRENFQVNSVLHRTMPIMSPVRCCWREGRCRLQARGFERTVLDAQPWDYGDVDEFKEVLAEVMGE